MTKDMTNDIQTTQPGGPQQGEIILYQPDATVRGPSGGRHRLADASADGGVVPDNKE